MPIQPTVEMPLMPSLIPPKTALNFSPLVVASVKAVFVLVIAWLRFGKAKPNTDNISPILLRFPPAAFETDFTFLFSCGMIIKKSEGGFYGFN